MPLSVSRFTTGRRVKAIAIIAVCGLYTVAVKVGRDHGSELVPGGLSGVLPSFSVALATPLIVFAARREVKFTDYLGVAVATAIGLVGYEIAQIWMPRRVFDWNDIVATFAGAVPGILLARLLFFRRVTGEGQRRD